MTTVNGFLNVDMEDELWQFKSSLPFVAALTTALGFLLRTFLQA